MGNCALCGEPLGNSVVGSDVGILHPLCFYKRESERPRDEVVQQLRRQVAGLVKGIRETHPCVICEWPRPYDNMHNICECCGFQEDYDDPQTYIWDGTWWAHWERKPRILVALESRKSADAVDPIADSTGKPTTRA